LVAVLVVAGGAVLLFAAREGPPLPETPELDLSVQNEHGFTVRYPRGWQVQAHEVGEERTAVVFYDPATGRLDRARRAFDVIGEKATLADARREAEEAVAGRFEDYTKVAIEEGLAVSGRPAFRHEFVVSGLRYDQWWVEREGGTFRITFWEPAADHPTANALNRKILATFEILAA
jgi:hypothetical protein